MIRIGPAINVPRIKNNIESICRILFFVRNVSPTTTGNIVSSKSKSYRNNGPNVAIPMKNFE